MKYVPLLIIAFSFLVLSSACAVSITKDVPNLVKGGEATVKLIVSNNVDKLDIAEFIPSDWVISNWGVSGIPKENVVMENYDDYDYLGKTYNMYHWSISDQSSDFSIEYQMIPQQTGKFKFITLWFSPDGFDSDEKTLTVNSAKTNSGAPITGLFVGPENQPTTENNQVTSETNTLSDAVNSLFSQKFY